MVEKRPGNFPATYGLVQQAVVGFERQIPDVACVQAVTQVVICIRVVQAPQTERTDLIDDAVGEAVRQNSPVRYVIQCMSVGIVKAPGQTMRNLLFYGERDAVVV